ncbi:MAG TPA: SDR family oxidoreductase [Longimicrobiales bacterium]|nr:SDR family oxidoreductase [Longimicrobiales bacterium]
MPNLAGKVAIVTGSTRGIGFRIAERLADAGASVVVSGRTAAGVEEAARRIGERAVGVPCDVADPEQCRRLVEEAVRRLGRLDVLVNNAGLAIFKPISEMSWEEWRLQIDVNLGGVFACSKAALPHLSASGDGFIVNIGSLAGRHFQAGGTGYNASKAGLIALTEAMMQDVRYDDVRVSIVMPGSVDTGFLGEAPEGGRPWALSPDDCALAVLHILEHPKRAHVSRVEMRPSQPRRR